MRITLCDRLAPSVKVFAHNAPGVSTEKDQNGTAACLALNPLDTASGGLPLAGSNITPLPHTAFASRLLSEMLLVLSSLSLPTEC